MAPPKKFLLRINPELYSELEAWAKAEVRSVNGQIEFLLQRVVIERRGGEVEERVVPPDTGEEDLVLEAADPTPIGGASDELDLSMD